MNLCHPFEQDDRRLAACLLAAFVAMPGGAAAQALNDAVNAQLASDAANQPCALLLSGDPASVLGSAGLFDICTRSPGQIDVPSSSVGGGFAATPPAPPDAVAERLDADEEESAPGGRGFFFTAAYDSVDREVSTFEDGYSSDLVSIAAGFDFVIGSSWVLGVAADASEQDGDFIDGGNFETQSVGLTGFGAFLFGESGSLDFYAGYAGLSNDRERRATFTEVEAMMQTFRVEGMPVADFDASQIIAGLAFSYDWVWDNVTLGPRLGYGYRQTDYDTYDEVDPSGLALTFHDDEETSSQFYGGLAGSAAISTSFGVVLIEQSILYRYETDEDQRNVEVSFVEDTRSRRFTYQTERPDRDFLQISVGATFILQNGLQVSLGYRGISSHRFLSSDGVELGFRKEF